jgi:hypothetical protein
MLPAHLAENIRKQVLFYLQSTFDFREKTIEKVFERFLTDPDSGLVKGPWVQLPRPFRSAEARDAVPFNFHVAFAPFSHQNRSWRRLSGESQVSNPMFVATPTGSGRTRDLLFTFLVYCSGLRVGQADPSLRLFMTDRIFVEQSQYLPDRFPLMPDACWHSDDRVQAVTTTPHPVFSPHLSAEATTCVYMR